MRKSLLKTLLIFSLFVLVFPLSTSHIQAQAPPDYSLSVNIIGNGVVTVNGSSPYEAGRKVIMTAYPSSGWEFTGWSGDLTGTANPDAIIMDDDKSVTCTFTEITGSICGHKWNDLDGDIEWDPGEPTLPGWEFILEDKDHNPIASTFTDSNGAFSFSDLPLGKYYVKETKQDGWMQTYPDGSDYWTVTLTEENPTRNNLKFGNIQIKATLIIEKKVEWGIDSQYVNHPIFEFTLGPQVVFYLGDGESEVFELESETYSISEKSGGWSTKVKIKGGGYDETIQGSHTEVTLEAGETVTVTFINRPPDFVIPEIPLGTILALLTMMTAFALTRKKIQP